jgi:hypothetical protein
MPGSSGTNLNAPAACGCSVVRMMYYSRNVFSLVLKRVGEKYRKESKKEGGEKLERKRAAQTEKGNKKELRK